LPKTGTLLTNEERHTFSEWLEGYRTRNSVSKGMIAAALDDESLARVNRYFRDGQIPTAPVLMQLAHVVGIPWPIALWRAGHFRAFLWVIDVLIRNDNTELREAAIAVALHAFPRRDVKLPVANDPYALYGNALIEALGEEAVPTASDLMRGLKGKLDPLLSRASDALNDTSLDAVTRRAVAAEYVNAWADQKAPAFAESVRTSQRAVDRLVQQVLDKTPNQATNIRRRAK
jgi:hypothetical protein